MSRNNPFSNIPASDGYSDSLLRHTWEQGYTTGQLEQCHKQIKTLDCLLRELKERSNASTAGATGGTTNEAPSSGQKQEEARNNDGGQKQ
ncbi:hypothetical protein NHQ30_011090 [Ciborinia camelliae]|nr:hypothetical protein NHQ30_011090 [Ciborinia camelliae]